MKRHAFLFRNLWIAIFFMSAYAEGMQLCQQLELNGESNNQFIMYLPEELLIHIFFYCGSSAIDAQQMFMLLIKQSLQFKTVCKRFYTILTATILGEMHKSQTVENKNKVLEALTRSITLKNYHTNRIGVILLLYMGACADVGMHTEYSGAVEIQYEDFSLLHKVLIQKDIELMALLLTLNANPNQIHPNSGPLFFFCPTIAIADLFFKNGANFNATDRYGNNVLWRIHQLSYELIEFYIDHNVNTRYINLLDNRCVLHALASPSIKDINNSSYFFRKGAFLIKKIYDMLNTLDKDGRTPIDLMEEKLKREFYNNSDYYSNPFKKLIAQYRIMGGKTAEELRQENK